MTSKPPIVPNTKVAALLMHYPQLEEVLIAMAPPFKKLRNPILRRSVAKVASLRQAAAVGKLPVAEMINTLREHAGQPPLETGCGDHGASYFGSKPHWFDACKIVATISEEDADPDVMPLKPLIRRASHMRGGEMLELITTFLPAPGIDLMKKKGYDVWSIDNGALVKTYFARSIQHTAKPST